MDLSTSFWTLIIAIITLLLTWGTYKVSKHKNMRRKRRDRFHRARQVIKTEYDSLVKKGLTFYDDQRLEGFRLLGKEGWIFDTPQELGSIDIRLSETRTPQEYKKTVRKMRLFWPPGKGGITIDKYSDAIRAYDRPTLWSEGTDTYRLVGVEKSGKQLELSYELGKYHDATNTQEAFGFVSATGASLAKYLPIDPFDFRARCASTAICTLTLIDSDPPQFVYHLRSSTAVHQGVGQYHIVPAGEFEPAVVAPKVHGDFNFWVNIRREYAEEFLNLPDGLGVPLPDGPASDHPTMALLNQLHRSKDFKLWEYGIGLNPVTLKPEILAIGVLSPLAEKEILLPNLMDHEGTKRVRELTYEELSPLIRSPETNPAAHALFMLAWRDRHKLLKNPPPE